MNNFFEKKEKTLLLLLEMQIKEFLKESSESNLRIDSVLKALEDLRSESQRFDSALKDLLH